MPVSGLEQDKLRAEYEEIEKLIAHLKEILASLELRMEIIKNEMLEMKALYGDERRTDIVYASEEFNPEDFYADEEMVITISHMGYIKRTPLSEYKVQNRGYPVPVPSTGASACPQWRKPVSHSNRSGQLRYS